MDPQLRATNEESRIFRPEALAAAARRLQGNVLVPQPRLLIFGTTLAVLVLPALIAILTFGEYTPRQAVSGYLVATGGAPAGRTWEAHLLAPGQSISFVSVGQEVVLSYSASHDHGTYSAVVRAVSETALPSAQWSDGLLRGVEPVYRVIATLQEHTLQGQRVSTGDESVALQPGMILTADIPLERRPLWRLLARPLLRFRGGA